MPKKPKAVKPVMEPQREVKRIHRWKPGHDPQDPDADPASGWQYLKLSGDYESDTRDKQQRYKKGGGPESGLPCMHCGAVTRIVEEVPALTILDQEFEITDPEKRKKLANEWLSILMCEQCGAVTQFRTEIIRHFRSKWLESQEKNNG